MFKSFHSTKAKGQGMVEYALILVLVAVVAIIVLSLIGTQISSVLCTINKSMGGASNCAALAAGGGGTAGGGASSAPEPPEEPCPVFTDPNGECVQHLDQNPQDQLTCGTLHGTEAVYGTGKFPPFNDEPAVETQGCFFNQEVFDTACPYEYTGPSGACMHFSDFQYFTSANCTWRHGESAEFGAGKDPDGRPQTSCFFNDWEAGTDCNRVYEEAKAPALQVLESCLNTAGSNEAAVSACWDVYNPAELAAQNARAACFATKPDN